MSDSLSKACSICGLEKPLSDFTQFLGAEGEESTYGNVCASCRKAYTESQKKPKKDREGTTTSTSGKQIDSKARVASEIEKSEERRSKDELYHEEDIKEEKEEKDILKKEEISNYEKKQLEDFLEKRSFLSTPRKADKAEAIAAKQAEQTAKQTQGVEQAEKQIETSKEEKQKTEVRLDVPFIDTQIAGKLKYSGRFKDFVNWIGKESIIGKAMGTEKRAQKKAGEVEASKKKPGTEETETPEEFIEKNWTPKSRGGGR